MSPEHFEAEKNYLADKRRTPGWSEERRAAFESKPRQIYTEERRNATMEDFLRILKQQDGEVTAFSEKLWCGLLDYATAYADGRLTFTFKNSSTFEG